MMKTFKERDYIVTPDGRTGRVSCVADGAVTCQFGADGPFEVYSSQSLRWATIDEAFGLIGEKPKPLSWKGSQGNE